MGECIILCISIVDRKQQVSFQVTFHWSPAQVTVLLIIKQAKQCPLALNLAKTSPSIPEDTVQYVYTVDPRFNEPLYNGIMNDIFQPSNSVMYGKNLDITNPRYNKSISPVPWHIVKSRFQQQHSGL